MLVTVEFIYILIILRFQNTDLLKKKNENDLLTFKTYQRKKIPRLYIILQILQ